MEITLIGSGNVATHIAKACLKAGLPIKQIWSRTIAHAEALANQVGASATSDFSELLPADVFIVSVNDDGIANLPITDTVGHSVIVHTSGATPISVFSGKFENYGVLYPLQTFSKSREIDFREVPLCIEASNETALHVIEELAGKLSDSVYLINSESRQTLHLAAVFACNFTNFLYTASAGLLAEKYLNFDLLRPLISETARKVQNAEPADVQTGPAVRGDESTMERHIKMLDAHPQLREMYHLISAAIKSTSV